METQRIVDISAALEIQGWMTEQELVWLARTAMTCRVIVEVGSYKGRSTRALADHCPGVVYAVDPWDGPYHRDSGRVDEAFDTRQFRVFSSNLREHIESGRVIPVRAAFAEVAIDVKRLPVGENGADLVFIDGDHRYESVRHDIFCARCVVRRGGIIAGHDYGKSSWPGVKKAVDESFSRVQLVGSIWSVGV